MNGDDDARTGSRASSPDADHGDAADGDWLDRALRAAAPPVEPNDAEAFTAGVLRAIAAEQPMVAPLAAARRAEDARGRARRRARLTANGIWLGAAVGAAATAAALFAGGAELSPALWPRGAAGALVATAFLVRSALRGDLG